MRVDEDNYGVLRHAEDMLGNDYEINITNDDECKGFIDTDNIVELIDDLCAELSRLNEELEDTKEYYETLLRDCYKPISKHEFYGVNEKEF